MACRLKANQQKVFDSSVFSNLKTIRLFSVAFIEIGNFHTPLFFLGYNCIRVPSPFSKLLTLKRKCIYYRKTFKNYPCCKNSSKLANRISLLHIIGPTPSKKWGLLKWKFSYSNILHFFNFLAVLLNTFDSRMHFLNEFENKSHRWRLVNTLINHWHIDWLNEMLRYGYQFHLIFDFLTVLLNTFDSRMNFLNEFDPM